MIKGISFWSFPGGTSIAEAFAIAKRVGFEAVEPAVDESGELALTTSDAEAAAIREQAQAAGIRLPTLATGLGWKYPVIGPDAEVCAQGAQVVRECLRLAKALGAEVVLCVPGTVTDDFGYADALAQCVERFRELGEEAARHEVVIGLENVWNRFLLSPVEFARVLEAIDRPYVQAYFDVGNVVINGFPDQWIRTLGPRVRAVHFKDFKRSIGTIEGFIDLLEGDVPWDRVMAALREVGYEGACTAEMMPPYRHFPERLLEATSQSMDAILSL